MNHQPKDERALLADARQQLSPSTDDVARVLLATRAALAAESVSDELTQRAPSRPHIRHGFTHSWIAHTIAALSIATASGAIGYALGVRATEQRARAAAVDVPLAAAPLPTAIAPRSTETPAAPAPREPAPPPHRLSQIDDARSTRDAKGGSMKEEIETMRRVDSLLHEQDPRRALALLQELDRNVPNGKLKQERAAALAMARCALGLGRSAQLADEFAAHYPGSVYLARVRKICEGDLRIRSTTETHD